jgi:ribonuclease VapC
MIVDSSAIVAILANEPERDLFIDMISRAQPPRLSAAAIIELSIVVLRRSICSIEDLNRLIDGLGFVVEPFTPEQARLGQIAYARFGQVAKHPAKLNFGDCFSYALARSTGEPLLFKGNDFSQTDITPAL